MVVRRSVYDKEERAILSPGWLGAGLTSLGNLVGDVSQLLRYL